MTHNEAITCMCMSRDCKFVVTGSKDQSLKIWESSTGYLTQVLKKRTDMFQAFHNFHSNADFGGPQ